MGKRYGRNKKRKHQEKIESLEALNEAHLRAIDMIDRDRSRALHALKELHEALNRANPYSSFLPPRVLSLHPDTLRHGPLELSEHKPVPVNFDPSADYAALDAPDVRRIPFYEVTAEIALNPERYQARCHLLLSGFAGRELASYHISEGALRDLKHNAPMRHSFAEIVTRRLVEFMAADAWEGKK